MNHEMDGIDCCCPIKSHKWNVNTQIYCVYPQMRTVIAGLFGCVIDSTKVCKKVRKRFPCKAKPKEQENVTFFPTEMFIYHSGKNNLFILHSFVYKMLHCICVFSKFLLITFYLFIRKVVVPVISNYYFLL